MLIDELVDKALAEASGKKIEDVRAGLGYTCVMLDDGSCGLAYTFRSNLGGHCGVLSMAGTLTGKDASEIIPWLKNDHLLRAAIGTAAANAVFNKARTNWETGNVTSALELKETDTFGMVGEFRPILAEVKKQTENIYVFEQDVPEGSQLYPDSTAAEHLPKCDVVVITATSIINHTFDELIPHCKNARQVCLVGPSTPLCPETFARYGVTLLAGTVVTDAQRILRIVSEGGGTMSMKPAVRQVLVRT
jgi:uncharacterized protein (DUF4213/DUF364 family)